MGRRRKHRKDLPARVYYDHGAYYFVPKDGKKIHLGREYGIAMTKWAELVARPARLITMAHVMDEYVFRELPKLKPRTQQDRLTEIGNLRAVFGKMDPAAITPKDIYGYKRERADAPIRCNRELSALSALFAFAIECGVTTRNPCRDVKRNKERSRDRCPEPAEIEDFKAICRTEFKDEQTALYVELKVVVGLRMGDMLKLHRGLIQEDGLRIDQGKRDRKQLFRFTDDMGQSTGLKELLDRVLALPRKVGSMHLFCRRDGRPYTVEGWQAMWQRRMAKYVEKGGARFWEHDIRAAAGVAMEEQRGAEEAQKLLGHTDLRTTRVYTGRKKVVKVVPIKKQNIPH